MDDELICNICGAFPEYVCANCEEYLCETCNNLLHGTREGENHKVTLLKEEDDVARDEIAIFGNGLAQENATLLAADLFQAHKLTDNQIHIVNELLQMDFKILQCILAAKVSQNIEDAISNISESLLCNLGNCNGKSITDNQDFFVFLRCNHKACNRCATNYFRTQLQGDLCMAVCPVCQEPKNLDDEEIANEYCQHLILILETMGTDAQLYSQIQRKYKSVNLKEDTENDFISSLDAEVLVRAHIDNNTYQTDLANGKIIDRECPLCFNTIDVTEMFSLMNCDDSICKECAVDHFTVCIREESILLLKCPICFLPNMEDQTKDEITDYFGWMSHLLKPILEDEIYQLFLSKVNEYSFSDEPDFVGISKNDRPIECPICFNTVDVEKLFSMINCNDSVCKDCAIHHFTDCIREKSILLLKCPLCNLPNMEEQTKDEIADYFGWMEYLLKPILETETYQLYLRKVNAYALSDDSNFVNCPNDKCQNGYIGRPELKRYQCPSCSTTICSKCREPWEQQHEHFTCAEFRDWKNGNDPESTGTFLNSFFVNNGITCPKCNIKFEFVRGGCMHYKCTQCNFEFCDCKNEFHKGPHDNCQMSGLHAHHPRNCMYYIRDEDIENQQHILQTNNIDFETRVDGLRNNAGCRLIIQEDPGKPEEPCNKPVEEGNAGYCEKHYKEYLSTLILKKNLEVVSIYDAFQLDLIITREGKTAPMKLRSTTDHQYAEILRKFIVDNIPLK